MWVCCSNIHTKEPKKEQKHTRVFIKRSQFTARPSWVVEATRKKVGSPRCASYRTQRAKPKDNLPFTRQSSIIGNALEYEFIRPIFLDIDGTLNHPNDIENHPMVICPECVNCLKTIIEQISCNIVLSSSWRLNTLHRRTLFTYLRAIEVEKGVVIGETRDLSSQNKSRTDEISDWLLNPNLYKEGISALQPWQIQSWISLDDMDLKGMELDEELKSHHFTIDPSLGLCKTQDIVMKVVEKLRSGWNSTYYRDKWQVVPKPRTKILRDISKKNLEKIEDLPPFPETAHEDKSSDDISSTDITLLQKFSGVDDSCTDSSQIVEDISNVYVTQNRFTESLERRSSVRVLSEGLPYSRSHLRTNSCRIIFQSGENGVGTPRMEYRPSMLGNVQAKTKPGYDVPEQHNAKEEQLQEKFKEKTMRHSSNMSFTIANQTKKDSLAFSSIASESDIGDLSSINLGSLRHTKMSDRRSRNSTSYCSVYFIGDCTLGNGENFEDRQ